MSNVEGFFSPSLCLARFQTHTQHWSRITKAVLVCGSMTDAFWTNIHSNAYGAITGSHPALWLRSGFVLSALSKCGPCPCFPHLSLQRGPMAPNLCARIVLTPSPHSQHLYRLLSVCDVCSLPRWKRHFAKRRSSTQASFNDVQQTRQTFPLSFLSLALVIYTDRLSHDEAAGVSRPQMIR